MWGFFHDMKETKLTDGLIMNGKKCPFKNDPCSLMCPLDSFKGIVQGESFSCAAARAFNIIGKKSKMVLDIHDEAKLLENKK